MSGKDPFEGMGAKKVFFDILLSQPVYALLIPTLGFMKIMTMVVLRKKRPPLSDIGCVCYLHTTCRSHAVFSQCCEED